MGVKEIPEEMWMRKARVEGWESLPSEDGKWTPRETGFACIVERGQATGGQPQHRH